MIDPIKLIRPNILSLSPYSTARDEYDGPLGVFLDANENPYNNGYNRYPDPHQKELKRVISGIKGQPVENIFIGNGSDEPIDLVYRMFCEPGIDNAVAITPSYGMYKVAAGINNVELREASLNDDFTLSTKSIFDKSDEKTKLIFLCSPNNPSGNSLDRESISELLENSGAMVILDEAYIDFSAAGSMLEELDQYPNLIILQTLSKAWGLAGLRLGLAFAREDVIGYMNKVKYPYNINTVTQKLVIEQLRSGIDHQVQELLEQRKYVTDQLSRHPLVRRIYPSDANFILVKLDEPRRIYDLLIRQGLIVRDRSHINGCEGCLRITIGTPEENLKLLRIFSGLS